MFEAIVEDQVQSLARLKLRESFVAYSTPYFSPEALIKGWSRRNNKDRKFLIKPVGLGKFGIWRIK